MVFFLFSLIHQSFLIGDTWKALTANVGWLILLWFMWCFLFFFGGKEVFFFGDYALDKWTGGFLNPNSPFKFIGMASSAMGIRILCFVMFSLHASPWAAICLTDCSAVSCFSLVEYDWIMWLVVLFCYDWGRFSFPSLCGSHSKLGWCSINSASLKNHWCYST